MLANAVFLNGKEHSLTHSGNHLPKCTPNQIFKLHFSLASVARALQDDPTLEMSTNNCKADFEIVVSYQNDTGASATTGSRSNNADR
jgi:hypothetical protein